PRRGAGAADAGRHEGSGAADDRRQLPGQPRGPAALLLPERGLQGRRARLPRKAQGQLAGALIRRRQNRFVAKRSPSCSCGVNTTRPLKTRLHAAAASGRQNLGLTGKFFTSFQGLKLPDSGVVWGGVAWFPELMCRRSRFAGLVWCTQFTT